LQRFRPNAAGRDLSAPERRQTRSFLACDTEGCSYEAVGLIFTRNNAQGAAGETVCATGRRWRGNIRFCNAQFFYFSRFFTVRAAPKTHEFHAFDATGEKRTARGLLDQLGHLPSYPSNTISRPKFVMDTKRQNEYRGLYGEARRVLETWAKLGTGQKDNREDESLDRWKRVRVRIPKLRRSLQKSEGSSVREFGRHREHPHSLNRCCGHVGGAHVHLGETVAESHHVAKT